MGWSVLVLTLSFGQGDTFARHAAHQRAAGAARVGRSRRSPGTESAASRSYATRRSRAPAHAHGSRSALAGHEQRGARGEPDRGHGARPLGDAAVGDGRAVVARFESAPHTRIGAHMGRQYEIG
jgi:hypothetical protein